MERNRILILARGFAKENNACGVCLKNIADELIKNGNEVYVISLSPAPRVEPFYLDSIEITELRENWFTTQNVKYRKKSGCMNFLFFKLLQLCRLPIALLRYPRVSRKQELQLLHYASRLVVSHNINYVLGSFSPCETIYVPVCLKNKFPYLTVVNYHLDPLLIPDNKSVLINTFKLNKGKKFVRSEIKVIDRLLAPESTCGIVDSDKIKYVGFPLYYDRLSILESGFVKNNDELTIVYVGTLDKENRNIAFTLSLLDNLNKHSNLNVKLHVWGYLMDSETKQNIEKSNIVEYHGIIDNKFVPDLMNKADFLLNISNKTSYNAVPSKIFQFFSSRKPIINIVRHRGDFALRYFNKYPAALSVDEYCYDGNLNILFKFIEENRNRNVALDNRFFEMYSPSFIAKLILNTNEE